MGKILPEKSDCIILNFTEVFIDLKYKTKKADQKAFAEKSNKNIK